jgi:hypothetical protein
MAMIEIGETHAVQTGGDPTALLTPGLPSVVGPIDGAAVSHDGSIKIVEKMNATNRTICEAGGCFLPADAVVRRAKNDAVSSNRKHDRSARCHSIQVEVCIAGAHAPTVSTVMGSDDPAVKADGNRPVGVNLDYRGKNLLGWSGLGQPG